MCARRVSRFGLTASLLLPVFPHQPTSRDQAGWFVCANNGSAAASFRKACLDETIDIQLVRPSRSVALHPLRNAKIGTTIKQSSHRISHFFFAT